MEFSRRQIKDALEWDGNSAIDGTDPDYYFDILEQADPRIIAELHQELMDNNWGLALSLSQSSSEPTEKSSEIRDSYDRFSWMNQF